MKTKAIIFAIATSLGAASAFSIEVSNQAEVLASGPVEGSDSGNHTLTILGRTVPQLSMIPAGTMATVYGVLDADGRIVITAVESGLSYVPGSDGVYLKGIVTSVNPAVGTLNMGDVTVDYTSLLSGQAFGIPSVGDSISVAGTQPVSRGTILADSVIGTGIRASSVIGTGIRENSVIGTGIRASSVIGTGIRASSVIGTGIRASSVIGTGIRAD